MNKDNTMRVKDNIIQIQDTRGRNYSIPQENIDSLIVYSDDNRENRHTDTTRNTIFSLRYTHFETWGSDEIAFISEIDVSKENYEQLRNYLDQTKYLKEPEIQNTCKITYFVDKEAIYENKR